MSAAYHFVSATDQPSRQLAIVGGGSTASTLLIRLAREIAQTGGAHNLTIHCFDRGGLGLGGLAYGACSPNHILNSVRGEMSPWDQDAFHQFCVGQGLGECRTDFNARSSYADFLKEQLTSAIDTLSRHGARLITHQASVTLRTAQPGLFDIHDEQTGLPLLVSLSAEEIVLATGYGPNPHFASLKSLESPAYIDSVYAGKNIVEDHPIHSKANPHIVFVGGGPALYDFVNDLHASGLHQARLTVIAKSHDKPLSVRDVALEEGEQNITPENLLSLSEDATMPDMRDAILSDFGRANTPRRAALDILKNLGSVLRRVDPAQAIQFRQSAFMGWLRHTATPIPRQSHERLAHYNPQVIRTQLRSDQVGLSADNTLSLHVGETYLDADLLVNGTGHGRHNTLILDNLKSDGLAKVDPVLDVLETDESGYRLAQSGITCIGPAIHHGCDGVESFDIYAKDFVEDYVSGKAALPRRALG